MHFQVPSQRGRKPIRNKKQELDLQDTKKKLSILPQEISELELVEHLHLIILILRNLSFIRANENQILKCQKLFDIIVSLFIDLADKEITLNCLDILVNLGK